MSVFPFLHFFNSIAYFYLAVYIFIKNPKALLNRICVVFLLCFALWSFSLLFVHNPYSSKHTAWLFTGISSLAWATFGSFFLWFILAFSGKEKILKKKWFYLLLFGIPLVFICAYWAGFLFTSFSKEWYGWKPHFARSPWPYLFSFCCFSFMGAGFYFNIAFIKKTRDKISKKQAEIIFITTLITSILGFFTDIIFPFLNFHFIPNMADTFALIWALGVIYAMVKYKFLTITPATAADNIISTMHDCLILLTNEGKITTVNKATLNLLGYEEDELKGKSPGMLFAPDGEDSKNHPLEDILETGNIKNKDLVFKTKNGKDIPMLFSSSVLRDESGTAGGIVCAAKDISERKKMEEEIIKSKKLESIGILAGGIAHDFNNILTVILGNISLALKRVPRTEKAYKYLLKSEEASLKAANLAGKFTPFSRGGWLRREEIKLADILRNFKNPANSPLTGIETANTGVSYDIDIDIPNNLWPIYGDEEQLDQVMQNLLLNSIEAIPGGTQGQISVRAENTIIRDKPEGSGNIVKDITALLLKKEKYVKIIVEDNCPGISKSDLEKVFDPYFSTKNKINQEGMGLGLTICYSIIKKHEGHITVESTQGKGTFVTLYLPASGGPAGGQTFIKV